MSSAQIYYTYYSPTDAQHPNKVQYTDNLGANGDILVTNSKGFENLNTRSIITSSWRDGIQKQNDFNYNVSITNGFKFKTGKVNYDKQDVVSSDSNIANTIAKQITLDDFDYDTIFGLTRVDPAVIDYNYYRVNKNVFGGGSTISNKEKTRIGPKLFLYKSTSASTDNDYTTGTLNHTLEQTATVNDVRVTTNAANGTYNYISSYSGQTLSWNNYNYTITNTETLYNLENAWPYKIQYKANQWYQLLTNGQKSALLTLPYWHTDDTEASDVTNRYYILNVEKGNDGNPVYSYYKMDKIVENNYYYIVSYFDTRPTIKTDPSIVFDSMHSSLFNENLVQILPLAKFDYMTYIGIHDVGEVSNIAACVPVCYTVSKDATQALISATDPANTSGLKNFGFNPIPIKYEKNITITTTLNYTVANMTNLSNLLTGWNYLHKNFSAGGNIISRGNLPYINAGILVYIPSSKEEYGYNFDQNPYKNKFIRFRKWLDSFNANGNDDRKYYYGYNTTTCASTNFNFATEIYNDIAAHPNSNTSRSLPGCINFNDNTYNDYLIHNENNIYDSSNRWFYENNNVITSGCDMIKFINTLSVPINNALNTTHTANDNYTFRLSKIKYDDVNINNTEYFYIIGTYIYITKNLDAATASANPHYLGFSPSTNVTLREMLNSGTAYLYPNKIIDGLMVDSSDPTVKYDVVGKEEGRATNTYALMKDIFITPSLYMTLNESVGDV